MFPAIDPADVQALTACIDWVVERLGELMRVLVAEKIGASGVALLREHFDVDEGDHLDRIDEYDGILIRSATKLTADVIERATRLKAIGRAGVGVDNVDVPAATKRGIVVANAPQSNVVTAAEHTLALLLALARNVPQAHASLIAGRWERSKFSGVELLDKTLGILGFGRIGQLVAHRAQGFGMRVIAFDPFVGRRALPRARRREGRVLRRGLRRRPTSSPCTCPRRRTTEGWLDAEALAKCKDGVRVLNVARGPLIVDEDLEAALDSGKVGGAALDVFRTEPITEHPLFGRPNVIVTPHLGASTAEATDRAGFQAAEQVVAALTGGVVSSAVNVPAVAAEDMEVLGPFLPLCRQLGRLAMALGRGVERRPRRGRAARAHRRARHAPARGRGPARRPRRPHRGGGQRGQRARRSPRSAGSSWPRRAAPRRATSPTSSA